MNITANDQIDTGFMLNSVYSVLPDGDSYTEAVTKARSRASRDMAPKASLDGADGAVACGAEYAMSQELRKAFLLPAVDQASDDFPNIITEVSRSEKL